MFLEPGDIICDIEVIYRDVYGRWWIKGSPAKGYLNESYVRAAPRVGGRLSEVVYLGNKRYAQVNYEDSLIRYYYSNNRRVSAKASHANTWQPRWKEVAVQQSGKCFLPSSATIPPPTRRAWRLVKGSTWVMPITESSYCATLGSDKQFCPASLKEGIVVRYVLPPCYERGPLYEGKRPPLHYRGILQDNQGYKNITLILHGFLDVTKWHTDVWKHLLYGTSNPPRYSDAAKQWWQQWLNYNPTDYEREHPFANCEYRDGGCIPCAIEQFQPVHEKIFPLLTLYWQKLITFWESAPTKKLSIIGASEPWEVEICTTEKITIGRNKYIWPWLVLRGWLWEDSQGSLVLHCNPVTFYMRDRYRPPEGRHATARYGEIYNLQSLPSPIGSRPMEEETTGE